LDHTLTKEGWRVFSRLKSCIATSRISTSKGGGLGVFIAPLKKLDVSPV
jgi:hypothetical protein